MLVAWIATTNAQTYTYNVDGWTPYGSLTLQNLTIKNWTTTNIVLSGSKIEVKQSNWQINVDKVCDRNWNNCRTVSQITTWTMPTAPDTYWQLNWTRLKMKTPHWLSLNDEVEINNASLKMNDSNIILQNNSIIRWIDNVTIESQNGTKSLKLSNNGLIITWKTELYSSDGEQHFFIQDNWLYLQSGDKRRFVIKNDWSKLYSPDQNKSLVVNDNWIQIAGDISLTQKNAKLKFSSWTWNYNFHINDNSWFVFEGWRFAAANWIHVQDMFELSSSATANLWWTSNIYGTATFTTKPTFNDGLVARVDGVPTFWVSTNSNDGRREIVASGQLISLRGSTEVKNDVLKVTGTNAKIQIYNDQESRIPWTAYQKVLSSIRLVPPAAINWSNMTENLPHNGANTWQLLSTYLPCDRNNEWTILYHREYYGNSSNTTRTAYWKLKICICNIDYKKPTNGTLWLYDDRECERQQISSDI